MSKSLFPAASPEIWARLEQSPTLRLINAFDWASNPLGPITSWPEGLKGAVRMIMAASTPMVMMVGPDGILIYNDAYALFAGNRHPDIFGLPVAQAWPEIAEFNRDKVEMGMRGDSITLHDEELLLNRHGQLESGWMDLHYSPILGDDGAPMGTLCVVNETTDRVLAEKALARNEERLSLALNGANMVGTWDWDVIDNVVTGDDSFAQMYGLDPLRAGLGVEFAQFLEPVHPDDRERVRAEIDASLADGSPYQSEYRLLDPEGHLRWVVGSGRPRLDGEGRAVRFPGVIVDITEQRRAFDALAQGEQRLRDFADTMPQIVWAALPDGSYDYFNTRWYEFTGMAPGSADADLWDKVIHPEDREQAQALWRRSLETGEIYQIEYRLRHHTGDYRWALGLALPVRDSHGAILRWFGTCTDIHENKLAAEERELVTQELSHRIKNIFAVLTGIISLSARNQPDIKPFADQLRQRIYALGEAHDLVRPHSKASHLPDGDVSFKALVERLLSPYRPEDESRIEFIGEDAEIDDGAATPLALLVHELATNAAKYGALSAEGGRVVIAGSVDHDHYRLSWKELGGPAIETAVAEEGFGSRLIALSVEGQLRGHIERFWEADGLRVEIDFPVSALLRSAKLSS